MSLLKTKLTSWLKRSNTRHLKFWGLLGCLALLYLKVWLPYTGWSIPCLFHELTGFYCPGCGMTRLTLALLQGNVYQAFRYNMLFFFLVPLYFLYVLLGFSGKKVPASVLMGVMLTLTLAFGVLRNTPQFAWLAPTDI